MLKNEFFKKVNFSLFDGKCSFFLFFFNIKKWGTAKNPIESRVHKLFCVKNQYFYKIDYPIKSMIARLRKVFIDKKTRKNEKNAPYSEKILINKNKTM